MVLLFTRKSLSVILSTVKNFADGHFSTAEWPFCCKGGDYHTYQKDPQDPAKRARRSKLLQHNDLHFHCSVTVGFYH